MAGACTVSAEMSTLKVLASAGAAAAQSNAPSNQGARRPRARIEGGLKRPRAGRIDFMVLSSGFQKPLAQGASSRAGVENCKPTRNRTLAPDARNLPWARTWLCNKKRSPASGHRIGKGRNRAGHAATDRVEIWTGVAARPRALHASER